MDIDARTLLLDIIKALKEYPFEGDRMDTINNLINFISNASDEEFYNNFQNISDQLDLLQEEVDAALGLVELQATNEEREASLALLELLGNPSSFA